LKTITIRAGIFEAFEIVRNDTIQTGGGQRDYTYYVSAKDPLTTLRAEIAWKNGTWFKLELIERTKTGD